MHKVKPFYWLAIVMLTGLLGACGGSDDSTAVPTNVTSGVAVDPYIVGAYLEEISADGTERLQSSLAPTDSQGRFTFKNPVKEGSIIRLKSSARGMHGNAPYTGMIKYKASIVDDSSVVISPLTTLVANGMSEDDVIKMMSDSGLPGLTMDDIYTDPVAGLENRSSGVDDAMLRNLRANMAANGYMEATGNFNYNGSNSSAAKLQLSDMVEATKETLNADLFEQLATELGNDFVLGDLINTAVQLNRTIVSQIRQETSNGGQDLPANRIDQIVSGTMADAITIAKDIYDVRNGDDGIVTTPDPATPPTTDPVTPPTTDPVPPPTTDPVTPQTGEELYVAECQGCHGSLQTTRISNRTAAGIEAAIAGNVGGMGDILLSPEETQLIAEAMPAPQPPPVQPPQYRNGQAVYDQECSGCHKLGTHDADGNIDLSGLGGTLVTKIEGGHMGKNLPTQELSALADFADTFTPPAPPVVPRNSQTVYDENCSGCHKLNGYDNAGNIDLAGMGSAAATKIPGGHGGSVSTEELTNLAAWLDSWAPVPPPVIARDGQTVYDSNCAGCHKLYGYDTAGNIDLASMGNTATTKLGGGHGGTVSTEEVTNVANWLDTWTPAPPPVVDRSGETLYNENCAGCHKLYGYDAAGNIDLASRGDIVPAKLGTGHGGTTTPGEVTNISNWLNTWAPEPPPVVARDGETIYTENCATCHKLYGYDANGNIDLASMGNTATGKLATGHGGAVSNEEVVNLTNWLDSWAPAPPPIVDRTGQVVYDDNCAGCHKLYGYDTAGNIDLASMGNTAITKLGTGHGGTVSAGEVTNIASWLDSWAPAPPPVVTRNGETVYNDNCSACHKVNSYDADGNIDLAGQGNLVPTKLATGHGGTVTADEQTNLVNWLNTFQVSDPYAGACDSCHGQPPSGNVFPDTAGSHGVHTALNGLNSNCAACHSDAAHNDQIDRGIATVWSAKSGTATGNSDNTCSNISCHGGRTTPVWDGGSIDVDTRCSSCHSYGTGQYNGYYSGEHNKHVRDKGFSCSTCHDANRLRNGHFTNLETRTFEQAPSATIKSSLSYSGGRCSTPRCHGGESW